MRQRLVQHLSFAKPLRLALVLSTILLALPQTAWGQTNYQSGTLNTTNNTWGDWNLSNGPTYASPSNNSLGFSNAGTITLTLTQPANTTDLIREISLEFGDGSTTLQSAKIGTTDIPTSSFQSDNSGNRTYKPAIPAGWSGDIVITLQGTNDAGSILSATVYTVAKYYGINIADVPVTNVNKDNVLGNGTISFTPATDTNPTNTLTLRGATIGDATTPPVHGITVTNLANLTIICAGEAGHYSNSDVYSTGTPIYCTDASCDLTFTSEENDNNYIQFNTNATNLVEGFKTVTYVENKAEQFLPQKQIGFITYKIIFQNSRNTGNVRLNTKTRTFDRSLLDSSSFEVLSGGGFTFDPATCKITIQDGTKFGRLKNEQLQQSAISTEIQWGVNADLTVVIDGDCQIIGGVDGTLTYYPFRNFDLDNTSVNNGVNPGVKISFEKGTNAKNANLALVGAGSTKAHLFRDFDVNDISLSNDLEWVSGLPVENSASISATYDDITIAGAPVTVAAGKGGITAGSGKVYFDGTNNILTLDGANVTGMIKTGLENLTIKLKGTNTIVTSSNNNGIYSDKNTGTLTFTKEETGASLNITSGVSVIRGFASLNLENSGLYTRSSTPYKMKSNAGYTRLADATKEETDTTAITSFYISESVSYQLWVAGNQVTEANKGDIFVEGTASPKASFAISGETKTLTLNAANITGMIVSTLGNLTIHLTGNNKINATGNEASLINSTNAGTLTFETDATPIGSLEFLTSTGGPFANTPWNGFTNVAYNSGLDYSETASSKKVGLVSYSLNIGKNQQQSGTEVTSANKNDVLGNGGKVTFDSENHILTLNGATISGSIFYEGTPTLTIALKGTNSVTNSIGTYAINSTGGSLNIVKATDATSAELTLNYGPSNIPISASYTLGSGLYLKPISNSKSIINEDPEFVTVDGFLIPDGGSVSDGATGTITYSASDKTLTITSFSKTFDTDAIKTSVSGLKVKLVGESTISCNNGGSAFTASTTSASIQFVKNDADSKLTMVTTLDPLFNFANGAITYDELYYYYDVDNHQYIIKPKNSPTIKFVERNQADGSIPTTQSAYQYVAENSTIQLTYGTDFYAPKPVFSDGYVLTDSTRYVYSMSVDGVVEFVLGGTDYHNSDKILYADNGKLNILKSGELTITCSFPGNNENEPCSASYTLKITRGFNNPFANQPAEQIYATYYNGDEDLTLPDGITAYVITGISGNTVTTTATGYLPHEVPVLLEKTGNVGTTITGYTGSIGNFSGNLLKYADQTFSSTGKEYVLYMNEFVKATGNIPDPKCYLDLSSVNPTRGMYGIGDGSTSIRELRMENEGRDEWYDLQGRRIEQPTKAGLYIKNGKKVIVNIK